MSSFQKVNKFFDVIPSEQGYNRKNRLFDTQYTFKEGINDGDSSPQTTMVTACKSNDQYDEPRNEFIPLRNQNSYPRDYDFPHFNNGQVYDEPAFSQVCNNTGYFQDKNKHLLSQTTKIKDRMELVNDSFGEGPQMYEYYQQPYIQKKSRRGKYQRSKSRRTRLE